MLQDVNDSDDDAMSLAKLLDGFPSHVNIMYTIYYCFHFILLLTFDYDITFLIIRPFNPWPGAIYTCSSNNRIHRFAKIVEKGGNILVALYVIF
jgi:23S rRNA (adenine2503-C2)-methyltransferase